MNMHEDELMKVLSLRSSRGAAKFYELFKLLTMSKKVKEVEMQQLSVKC